MKVRVYLRVARTSYHGRTKVAASVKPPHEPLRDASSAPLPTAVFGLDITLDDGAFRVPIVAEVNVPAEHVSALVESVG
jgi:hypothetical protein